MDAGETALRNPMRGIFFPSCAPADTQSRRRTTLNAKPVNFLLIRYLQVLILFTAYRSLLTIV
jgi:hypothetical protein